MNGNAANWDPDNKRIWKRSGGRLSWSDNGRSSSRGSASSKRRNEEYRRKLLDERRRELRSKREEDAQQEQRERASGVVSSPEWKFDDRLLQETRASQTAAPGGSSPTAAAHEKKSVPIFIPEQLKQKHTLEQMNNAASRIQREYRVHQASRALDDIASQFKQLQQEFAYPRVIDFKKPGGERGHITVPANRPPSDFTDEALKEVSDCEGKLDYTSTNYPLHAYSDALDKLLMKLDGVESRGEKSIREKRRGIVKEIEKEVSRLDWYWRQAWIDYIKAQETAMDL
ncbi:hypothetical protein M413DRAFT_444959 [Hebeloma cylindrosporum]|uniref:BAG domain-containing protein n=1 Tax=Hebeloma cylindrosporum TaxID=76867 RepID=A0A0C3BYQ6_HEBCY|nr:hypothetical protein M413DRAFT_444959 [Hebeloma cylindrosporum h7]